MAFHSVLPSANHAGFCDGASFPQQRLAGSRSNNVSGARPMRLQLPAVGDRFRKPPGSSVAHSSPMAPHANGGIESGFHPSSSSGMPSRDISHSRSLSSALRSTDRSAPGVDASGMQVARPAVNGFQPSPPQSMPSNNASRSNRFQNPRRVPNNGVRRQSRAGVKLSPFATSLSRNDIESDRPVATREATELLAKFEVPADAEGDSQEFYYLPTQYEGTTILRKTTGNTFFADNTVLQDKTEGIRYRASKHLEDQPGCRGQILPWGSIIKGEDAGDGWVKISRPRNSQNQVMVDKHDGGTSPGAPGLTLDQRGCLACALIAKCGSIARAFQKFDPNGTLKVSLTQWVSTLEHLHVNTELVCGKPAKKIFMQISSGGQVTLDSWSKYFQAFLQDPANAEALARSVMTYHQSMKGSQDHGALGQEEQELLSEEVAALDLKGVHALAYVFLAKLGSLERAFKYLDVNNQNELCNYEVETGLLLLNMDAEKMTGLKPRVLFKLMGNGSDVVRPKAWVDLFSTVDEHELKQRLHALERERGTLADRARHWKKTREVEQVRAEQELLKEEVVRLGLQASEALAYVLLAKAGSLQRAFTWFDTNDQQKFSSNQWETGLLVHHIDVEALTGLSASQLFHIVGNASDMVSGKRWQDFFSMDAEQRLKEQLDALDRTQGSLAERAQQKQKLRQMRTKSGSVDDDKIVKVMSESPEKHASDDDPVHSAAPLLCPLEHQDSTNSGDRSPSKRGDDTVQIRAPLLSPSDHQDCTDRSEGSLSKRGDDQIHNAPVVFTPPDHQAGTGSSEGRASKGGDANYEAHVSHDSAASTSHQFHEAAEKRLIYSDDGSNVESDLIRPGEETAGGDFSNRHEDPVKDVAKGRAARDAENDDGKERFGIVSSQGTHRNHFENSVDSTTIDPDAEDADSVSQVIPSPASLASISGTTVAAALSEDEQDFRKQVMDRLSRLDDGEFKEYGASLGDRKLFIVEEVAEELRLWSQTLGEQRVMRRANSRGGLEAAGGLLVGNVAEFVKDTRQKLNSIEPGSSCEFPADLKAAYRRVVHLLAEDVGLQTMSEGVGDSRHIVAFNFGDFSREIRKQLRSIETGKSMAFPTGYSMAQRKMIHMMAAELGLWSHSQGDGDDRHVEVFNLADFSKDTGDKLHKLREGEHYDFDNMTSTESKVVNMIADELGLVSSTFGEVADGRICVANLHEFETTVRAELNELEPGDKKLFEASLLQSKVIERAASDLNMNCHHQNHYAHDNHLLRVERPAVAEVATTAPRLQGEHALMMTRIFDQYATGSNKGQKLFLRAPDMCRFVEDLADINQNKVKCPHKFSDNLEVAFEETLELQQDLGTALPGLTLYWFQVFVQKAARRVGWSVIGVLFAMVDNVA